VTSISTFAVPPGWIVVRGVFSVTAPNGAISSCSCLPASVWTVFPSAFTITSRTVTGRGGKVETFSITTS